MKNYVEQKEKDATVIGVVGNAKKGKSYILGKISNNPLPAGHSVTTEGICVKYPTIENTTVIILDSAGSEAPLVENDEVKLRFFRFVSMPPIEKDDQNDGTFMIGGE